MQVVVFLKVDFEQAYDKVNRDFLPSCLQEKGLSVTWCKWTHQILHNGAVYGKINKIGPYFQSAKGVRQGDLFVPFPV